MQIKIMYRDLKMRDNIDGEARAAIRAWRKATDRDRRYWGPNMRYTDRDCVEDQWIDVAEKRGSYTELFHSYCMIKHASDLEDPYKIKTWVRDHLDEIYEQFKYERFHIIRALGKYE